MREVAKARGGRESFAKDDLSHDQTPPAKDSRPFGVAKRVRLVDLLEAAVLLLMVLTITTALGLPILQRASEQARRFELQNNLTNNSGARRAGWFSSPPRPQAGKITGRGGGLRAIRATTATGIE